MTGVGWGGGRLKKENVKKRKRDRKNLKIALSYKPVGVGIGKREMRGEMTEAQGI